MAGRTAQGAPWRIAVIRPHAPRRRHSLRKPSGTPALPPPAFQLPRGIRPPRPRSTRTRCAYHGDGIAGDIRRGGRLVSALLILQAVDGPLRVIAGCLLGNRVRRTGSARLPGVVAAFCRPRLATSCFAHGDLGFIGLPPARRGFQEWHLHRGDWTTRGRCGILPRNRTPLLDRSSGLVL